MALSTLSDISAALSVNFNQRMEFLMNRQAKFLSLCAKEAGSHKKVYWTVSNSGAAASIVSEGSDVQSSELLIDDKIPLELSRVIFRSAFGLSHTEIAVAERSAGSAAEVMNILGTSMNDAASALVTKVNQQCFLGTGSSEFSGLIVDALKTSGTYAGKNVASYAGLQSNVQTSVGTLASTHLDKAMDDIYKNSGVLPDVILCSPRTHSTFKALCDAKLQLQTATAPALYNLGTAAPAGDLPVSSFNGVGIWTDKDIPDGYILMFRREDLVLDILPYRPFGDAPGARNQMAVERTGMGDRSFDLPVHVYPLAKVGSSVKFAVELEACLKVKAPNRTALLRGITVSP